MGALTLRDVKIVFTKSAHLINYPTPSLFQYHEEDRKELQIIPLFKNFPRYFKINILVFEIPNITSY